jgi:erythromycin esterase
MSRYLEAVIARIGGDTDTYDAIRGECMAGNLEYLMNDLFPGEKIIIWANNAHIRHDNASIETGVASMGTRLHELYRPELFTIGLYMYRGRVASADGASNYEIEAPTSVGLEAILYRIRKEHSLVDLLGQTEVAGNSWMFQDVTARAWGTDEYHMVPRNQYDAILFVNSVMPPRFYWP